VPDTGVEVEKYMSKTIQYSDEPLGKLEIIEDFLPSPKILALKEENVKVTIALSKESVDFFKSEANKHKIKYQRMIRQLLDIYVEKQKASNK
jgi:predicted DNA binding CopG/RHH family protein